MISITIDISDAVSVVALAVSLIVWYLLVRTYMPLLRWQRRGMENVEAEVRRLHDRMDRT